MDFSQYVRLVAQAEKALVGKGKTSLEDRVYLLGGIYYATKWSAEYVKLKADDRRKVFERCLHKTYTDLEDPKKLIGMSLYEQLLKNQDVGSGKGAVDVGHLLIGLAARLNADARTEVLTMAHLGTGLPIPGVSSTKSTGLEILTWVGDLAGATGRLALARAEAAAAAKPGTPAKPVPASRFFTGKDYGGPSNLRGDVYAYALAATGGAGGGRPAIGPPYRSPTDVADALDQFLVKGRGRADACKTFLAALGATSVTTSGAIEAQMADKFEAFGYYYIISYLKTFKTKAPPPPKAPPPGAGWQAQMEYAAAAATQQAAAAAGAVKGVYDQHSAATPYLRDAAVDVAKLFLKKLQANDLN